MGRGMVGDLVILLQVLAVLDLGQIVITAALLLLHLLLLLLLELLLVEVIGGVLLH